MKCPICGQENYKKKFIVDKFEIVKCNGCGLVSVNNRPSFDEIMVLYNESYFNNKTHNVGYLNYNATEKSLRINFKKRAEEILKCWRNPNFDLLDIGASTGYFVSECNKLGINAEGIEVSGEAVDFASNQLGLNIVRSALEEFESNKKYDVITAWDVVEHSAYPDKFFKKVNSLLKIKGMFLFTTGDIESMISKISGRKWHLFNLPDHLFFYSPKTIKRILEINGFQVKSIKYPWNYYNLGYLIERFLKKFLGFKNSEWIKKLAYNNTTKNIILPFNLFDIMEVKAAKKYEKK